MSPQSIIASLTPTEIESLDTVVATYGPCRVAQVALDLFDVGKKLPRYSRQAVVRALTKIQTASCCAQVDPMTTFAAMLQAAKSVAGNDILRDHVAPALMKACSAKPELEAGMQRRVAVG